MAPILGGWEGTKNLGLPLAWTESAAGIASPEPPAPGLSLLQLGPGLLLAFSNGLSSRQGKYAEAASSAGPAERLVPLAALTPCPPCAVRRRPGSPRPPAPLPQVGVVDAVCMTHPRLQPAKPSLYSDTANPFGNDGGGWRGEGGRGAASTRVPPCRLRQSRTGSGTLAVAGCNQLCSMCAAMQA